MSCLLNLSESAAGPALDAADDTYKTNPEDKHHSSLKNQSKRHTKFIARKQVSTTNMIHRLKPSPKD
jgi:hypothetical protein